MFCKNCGSNVDDKAEICPHCGVRIVEPRKAGNTIAIVGFILSFFVALAGLVCSIVGRNKATKEGAPYGNLALAGMIIAIVNMVLGAVLEILRYCNVLPNASEILGSYMNIYLALAALI